MSVQQERSPVLGMTMRELREARLGDLSPGGHRRRSPNKSPMKTPSTSSNPIGHPHHHAQAMLQRRHSKASKSSTPTSSSSRRPSQPDRDSSRASFEKPQTTPKAQEQGYFFGINSDQNNDDFESSGAPKFEPSPSSSSIKSFGAAVHNHMPLDGNPEFEAFKRQADLNSGRSLALPTHGLHLESSNSAPVRPRPPPRWHTHSIGSGSDFFAKSQSWDTEECGAGMDIDQDSSYIPMNTPFGVKRNSVSSTAPNYSVSSQVNESARPSNAPQRPANQTILEDSTPRLSSMDHNGLSFPLELPQSAHATATHVKSDNSDQPLMISASQMHELMGTTNNKSLLILDIRSASSYAQSRIRGALNICVPTMLLKRATFNTAKLEQTLQREADIAKFSNWASMKCIVVYDSHSSEKKDAVTAINMTKKFTGEGFEGNLCILRGGFQLFCNQFANLVDSDSLADHSGENELPSKNVAPVIGGVKMPVTKNEPNPFFSEIRQNMDLADGVGQFDVKKPHGLASPDVPQWLGQAAADADHGKQVSDKFLSIEREEQTRMRGAFAAFNANASQGNDQVQLCGVEQGRKNRYKNILPFEHARVKLLDTTGRDCDYFNASHIQASRSKKKYIATQGPLPTTFDDFWSVVWEQDIRVIVMLTAESEGGQLKCHPYWKGGQFGNLKLKLLSENKTSLDMDKHQLAKDVGQFSGGDADSRRKRANTTTDSNADRSTRSAQAQNDDAYVYIRKFALSNALRPFEQMREVTHIHFSAWPDFGTPAQPSHLLALVELANVMQRAALPFNTTSYFGSESNLKSKPSGHLLGQIAEPEDDEHIRPMLVHCSAGCGRTGTFCTVDSVIDMLKRQKQAGQGALGAQDSEGDTAMADNVAVSTSTTQERDSQQSASPAPHIDVSWIRGDRVDLIQKTVEDFREQRLSMVQSLRQYVLCYETVLEWVHRAHETSPLPAIHSR